MKALVTGSARGLGRDILFRLWSKHDFDVVLNARNKEKDASSLYRHLWKDAGKITVKDLEKLNIDIVVNNAFDKNKPVESGIAQVNLLKRSVMYFTKRGGGTIVNINSIAAFDETTDEYSAAKKALRECSKELKVYAYQNNIRIIDVYPGAIKTGWASDRKDWDDLIDPAELADLISNIVVNESFYVDEIIIRRPKC